MEVTSISRIIVEGLKEYKITDETPKVDKGFHTYSIICWKKGPFTKKYKLHHVENHIIASSFETALKAYKVKQKLIKAGE